MMKELLSRIAVLGTENRFDAILAILEEYGIKYTVQEQEYEYKYPVYQRELLLDDGEEDSPEGSEDVEGQMDLSEFINMPEEELESENDSDYMEHLCNVLSLFDDGCDETIEDDEYYFDEEDEEGEEYEGLPDFDIDDEFDSEESLKEQKEASDEFGIGSYYDSQIDYARIRRMLHKFNNVVAYREEKFTVRNIIVSLKDYCKDKNPNLKKVVLSAHYDAVTGSTAANDNGSGVAILIAFILEVMKKGETDQNFEIVFTDREETGGYGCRQYITEFGDGISEVINLDTCGVGNYVVVDMNDRTEETMLYDKEVIKQNDVFIVPKLPYCDSDIFRYSGYGVTTVCSLPDSDLFEKSKSFASGVYQYIHNGEKDSIEYINYEVMNKILSWIKNMI